MNLRPSQALVRHAATIRSIVAMHGAANPRVFGSVARGDDGEDSDIDLLVDVIAGRTSLMGLVRIKRAIEALTGISTDIVTPQSLNERIRGDVLREARPV